MLFWFIVKRFVKTIFFPCSFSLSLIWLVTFSSSVWVVTTLSVNGILVPMLLGSTWAGMLFCGGSGTSTSSFEQYSCSVWWIAGLYSFPRSKTMLFDCKTLWKSSCQVLAFSGVKNSFAVSLLFKIGVNAKWKCGVFSSKCKTRLTTLFLNSGFEFMKSTTAFLNLSKFSFV